MSVKTRITIIVIAIFQGVLFLSLSWLVNLDQWRNFDLDSLISLQNFFSRSFDFYLSWLTVIGSSELSLLIILALFSFILFKKKHLFLGIFLFFLIYLIELIGKLTIYHPKPPGIVNRYILDFRLPSSYFVNTLSSYPSGHMARVSFIAIILLYLILNSRNLTSKKLLYTAVTFLTVVLMFVSRIYLGEHWFTDVVGGMLLGQIVALIALSFW